MGKDIIFQQWPTKPKVLHSRTMYPNNRATYPPQPFHKPEIFDKDDRVFFFSEKKQTYVRGTVNYRMSGTDGFEYQILPDEIDPSDSFFHEWSKRVFRATAL